MEKLQMILANILGCGYDDVHMLTSVEYDLEEVKHEVIENGWAFTLDNMMYAVMSNGLYEIGEMIRKRMKELDSDFEEYKELAKLDVSCDFEITTNSLATGCDCINNDEIYFKYLQHALDHFEQKTGICIN